MVQALFFLPNGIAHSGIITPFSSFHCAAIGVCMPGQSRAIHASDSKPCADTSAKPQTLDLSHYFRLCNLPCINVLCAILRDPSEYALMVMCLYLHMLTCLYSYMCISAYSYIRIPLYAGFFGQPPDARFLGQPPIAKFLG